LCARIERFGKLALADYRIQAGQFHVAGVSNVGISEFNVAAAYPH
jgi:hypothetical protein